MRFEVVEQLGWDDVSEHHPVDAERGPTEGRDAGPAGPASELTAATARLVSGVRAEAHRIEECVAEMSDLAAQVAEVAIERRAWGAVHPPVNFRAARFGPARRERDSGAASGRPAAGTGGSET